MASDATRDARPVLVVGATGDLGGRTVRALLARGHRVRALVRPGSESAGLRSQGVEIAEGDMLAPPTLEAAMTGVSAVVSSAIGYSRRRPSDSLRTDFEGNHNLVDAAKKTQVPRFIFLSILACEKAPGVPHFWAKKVTEDYLAAQGVPFVALRPGAFLGAPTGRFRAWMLKAIERGRMMTMTTAGVRMTYIAPDEVARALAMAVDEPRAVGQRIDLGSDRAVSGPELAELVGRLLGRPIVPSRMGTGGFGLVLRIGSVFNRGMRGLMTMVRFFQTGQYVADTRRQAELFGPVPRLEDAARQMLQDLGLLPTPVAA